MAHIGESFTTFDNLTRHAIAAINPERILGIGAGGGKYGALLKNAKVVFYRPL